MDRAALDDFIERARGVRRREELDAAAVEVLDAFEAVGVEPLLLKGPALARLLYTENENRGYSDVDLLVAPRDLEHAREALRMRGYRRAGEQFGIDDVAGIQHSETWAQRGVTGPLWIDLHWRLGGCEAEDEVVWEGLRAGRASIDLQDREAAVLGTDGLAFHLALHAAQHGPSDGKAMGDLGRGVERWDLEVWRGAARLARELNATPTFSAGLRLLPQGSAIADQLALPETERLEWEILHREARPRGTFHLQAWRDARGLRQRANVLRRSLLPTPEWVKWEFPWAARSKPRLLVAYACHLVRAPLWTVRAWQFRRKARRAGSRA